MRSRTASQSRSGSRLKKNIILAQDPQHKKRAQPALMRLSAFRCRDGGAERADDVVDTTTPPLFEDSVRAKLSG